LVIKDMSIGRRSRGRSHSGSMLADVHGMQELTG
jgi:hypothetical protein